MRLRKYHFSKPPPLNQNHKLPKHVVTKAPKIDHSLSVPAIRILDRICTKSQSSQHGLISIIKKHPPTASELKSMFGQVSSDPTLVAALTDVISRNGTDSNLPSDVRDTLMSTLLSHLCPTARSDVWDILAAQQHNSDTLHTILTTTPIHRLPPPPSVNILSPLFSFSFLNEYPRLFPTAIRMATYHGSVEQIQQLESLARSMPLVPAEVWAELLRAYSRRGEGLKLDQIVGGPVIDEDNTVVQPTPICTAVMEHYFWNRDLESADKLFDAMMRSQILPTENSLIGLLELYLEKHIDRVESRIDDYRISGGEISDRILSMRVRSWATFLPDRAFTSKLGKNDVLERNLTSKAYNSIAHVLFRNDISEYVSHLIEAMDRHINNRALDPLIAEAFLLGYAVQLSVNATVQLVERMRVEGIQLTTQGLNAVMKTVLWYYETKGFVVYEILREDAPENAETVFLLLSMATLAPHQLRSLKPSIMAFAPPDNYHLLQRAMELCLSMRELDMAYELFQLAAEYQMPLNCRCVEQLKSIEGRHSHRSAAYAEYIKRNEKVPPPPVSQGKEERTEPETEPKTSLFSSFLSLFKNSNETQDKKK